MNMVIGTLGAQRVLEVSRTHGSGHRRLLVGAPCAQ
jgi:hypothetical protein